MPCTCVLLRTCALYVLLHINVMVSVMLHICKYVCICDKVMTKHLDGKVINLTTGYHT